MRSRTQGRSPGPRGVTLLEVMVTSTIMGILISLSVPSFRKAMEQSRVDIAAANLRAIWSAERVYWLEHRAYTADLAELEALGLIDPAIVKDAVPFAYSVTSADGATFRALADREGEPSWGGELAIDQSGAITGNVLGASGETISPGFE